MAQIGVITFIICAFIFIDVVQSGGEGNDEQPSTSSPKQTSNEGDCLFRHFKVLFVSSEEIRKEISQQECDWPTKVENFQNQYSKSEITVQAVKDEIKNLLQIFEQNFSQWFSIQTDNKPKDGTENEHPHEENKKQELVQYEFQQKLDVLGEKILNVCKQIDNDDTCPEGVKVEESLQTNMRSVYLTIRGANNKNDATFEFNFACHSNND